MTLRLGIHNLLDIVAQCKSDSLRRNRRSVLLCLRQYLDSDEIQSEQLTKETVDGFLSWLVKSGKSTNTIELYRKELRAILLAELPQLEHQLKSAFQKTAVRRSSSSDGLTIDCLRLLAKAEFGDRVELTQARDLFMFAFYCGGLDFNAVKALTTRMTDEHYIFIPSGLKILRNANIQSIIAIYADAGEELIFPFCRRMSEQRYGELLAQIASELRIPKLKEHHAETKAWVSIARKLGISLPIIASAAYKSVGVLNYYSAENRACQKDIDKAVNQVSISVADTTEHWYAMKLRSNKTPENIYALVYKNEKYPYLRNLETYYPEEDINVKVGRRYKQETRAYINGVLFFRTKPQHVQPLFSLIRDVAWIYRQSNTASSPYAVIPQEDMRNFQCAVSQFTNDIEISLVRNSDIVAGRRVRLTAGRFAGCEGIIEDEIPGDFGPTDLRNFIIRFTSENSIRFRISVSEAQLQPIV